MVYRKNVNIMCGLAVGGEPCFAARSNSGLEVRSETTKRSFPVVTDRSYPIFGRFDRYEVDLNRGVLRKRGRRA